jgi:hypothetical protein
LADENPELQGELIKLGIKFMTTNSVTTADKKVREIYNLIAPDFAPAYKSVPQLNNSDQELATRLDLPWHNDGCFWTNVEINNDRPLPMVICSNTAGNKVKLITDWYGSSIAVNDDDTRNFVKIKHQVAMGIPLNKIPQVRMYIKGVDINGIEPINFIDAWHPHILVITKEGGGRTEDVCISSDVCVRHSNEKLHLITKGQTHDNAIANMNDANVPLRSIYGKVEILQLDGFGNADDRGAQDNNNDGNDASWVKHAVHSCASI